MSICINGKQVVTGEKLDVSKEDFLSGNIDFKELLQKYSKEKDNESKGFFSWISDWF